VDWLAHGKGASCPRALTSSSRRRCAGRRGPSGYRISCP
jgi:hypothetical protein